jgi:hypothetical protein
MSANEKRKGADRTDVKAAFERFRSAVREACRPGVQAKIFQALDQLEQEFMSGIAQVESAKAGMQQIRGKTRHSLRDSPNDMVRLLKGVDGMEDEILRFFAALEGGK